MKRSKSIELYKDALKFIPGGVNSPVRSFKAMEIEPIFLKKGKGSKVYDVDDNEYIDYICSWGSLILGHTNPKIISAVKETLELGSSFGLSNELEITLAKEISSAFPSIEMMRMVNSGTEAVMSAIRVARGFTGREKLIKFEGCYHGHVDSMLVEAGSGGATFGVPISLGILKNLASSTLTLSFNDLEEVERIIELEKENIAAVILEPIPGNMGVIIPKNGFLQRLREITEKYGILLIFDEVISGFRFTYGGVQNLYHIKPDLTCLGKIIGGGFPVGVYGGRREIMEMVSPLGGIYQAGTLSGNPVALRAGIETLSILKSSPSIYKEMDEKSSYLVAELKKLAQENSIPLHINRMGSIFTLFFTSEEVFDYKTARRANQKNYAHFFKFMLERGVLFPPSQFEASFLSASHSWEDLEKTLDLAEDFFSSFQPEKLQDR